MHIGIGIGIVVLLIFLQIIGHILVSRYIHTNKEYMTSTTQQIVEKLNYLESEVIRLRHYKENSSVIIEGLKERIEKLEERD